MNEILDQILNKLLSERDKLARTEEALSAAKSTIFSIRNYFDAADDGSLVDEVGTYINRAEGTARRLAYMEELAVPDIERAVSRAVIAAGLTPSGNLKTDAENLARLLESNRAPITNML
jgi:hypothetical protein